MADLSEGSVPVRVATSAQDLHASPQAAPRVEPVKITAIDAIAAEAAAKVAQTVNVAVAPERPTGDAAASLQPAAPAEPLVATTKPVAVKPADGPADTPEVAEPHVTEPPVAAPAVHTDPLTQAEVAAALAGHAPGDAAAEPIAPVAVVTSPVAATPDAEPAVVSPAVPLADTSHHAGMKAAIITAVVVVAAALGVIGYFDMHKPASTTQAAQTTTSGAPVSTSDSATQAATIDQSMSQLDGNMSSLSSGLNDQQGDVSE